MKHFINLKDIPAKDLRRILIDAKKRKKARKKLNNLDPIAMYMNDVFTVPTSLAGLPGISLPSGLSSNGLPLGVQIIGNYFEEKKLLQLSNLIEKELSFNE